MLFRLLPLLLLLIPAGCSPRQPSRAADTSEGAPQARYLFLFIGDGMGSAQLALGGELLGGGERLAIASMPVSGLADTHALDRRITDSAAAGTALSSGSKSVVGSVGMGAAGQDTLCSITEHVLAAGMQAGVVTTVSIDHATPACFYAHSPSRKDLAGIAGQMPASGVAYLAGGAAMGEGRDSTVTHAMRRAGYRIVEKLEGLARVEPGQPCWYRGRHDASGALPFAIDRRPRQEVPLPAMVREGIRLLDNPQGFFMMVEGGRIDWACHANDAAAAAREVLDFDRAVGVALDFLARHPEETLVVVTADHECGGLALGSREEGYGSDFAMLAQRSMSSYEFARRVASWRTGGAVGFPAALDSLRAWFGVTAVAPLERSRLEAAYGEAMAEEADEYGADPFTLELFRQMDSRAGIGWTTGSHTALPVPVFAAGVGAERFAGWYDNTAIPVRMLRAAALRPGRPMRGGVELSAADGRCQTEAE